MTQIDIKYILFLNIYGSNSLRFIQIGYKWQTVKN